MSDSTHTPATPGDAPDTGHDYDGIRELDNRLPNWWLVTLFATIVFAAGYWIRYEMFEGAPRQLDEFRAEMDAAAAEAAKRALARGGVNDEALQAMAQVAATLESGHATYTQFCIACHGDKGQGLVGPNLTDAYWLHGSKPTEILATVGAGIAAKGMPAWAPVLGPSKVEQVVAYLLSIRNTNVPGKEPQGDEIK
jgi:cytochrome c oxidase cbb3-type subunit 3